MEVDDIVRIIAALESIAKSLKVLATPSCGHGTVGFCNVCFVLTMQEQQR